MNIKSNIIVLATFLLSGCATFVDRNDFEEPRLYPATQMDFVMMRESIKGDSHMFVADNYGILRTGCFLIGLVDTPFSLCADTIMIPWDIETKREWEKAQEQKDKKIEVDLSSLSKQEMISMAIDCWENDPNAQRFISKDDYQVITNSVFISDEQEKKVVNLPFNTTPQTCVVISIFPDKEPEYTDSLIMNSSGEWIDRIVVTNGEVIIQGTVQDKR